MTLEEFKTAIEKNTLALPLVIAVCEDESSNFIFHQYLNAYAKNNGLDIEITEDTYQSVQFNLFTEASSNLKVCYTTKLDRVSIPNSYTLWIRCKSITDELKKQFQPYIVNIGKLEPWHIKDYVYTICEDVPKSELDYFLKVYGSNIYRIDNEIQKLTSFVDTKKIYPEIKDQLYTDVSEFSIFDLVTSIVKCDIMTLKNILLRLDSIDVDVFGFLKLLMTNFKRVIDVQLTRNPVAKNLGLSDKQLWAIRKYSCGIYTRNQLLSIYEFLTACDYYIKSGYLSTDIALEYIITKMIMIKEM